LIFAYSSSARPRSGRAARSPASRRREPRVGRWAASSRSRSRHRWSCGNSGEAREDRGEEAEPVERRPGERLDGVLRVRHDADDVAGLVRMAAMSRIEPLGLPPTYRATRDPRLRAGRGCPRRRRTAFAVLDRMSKLLAGGVFAHPRRGRVGHAQQLVAVAEVQVACGRARRAAGGPRRAPGSRCRCRAPAGRPGASMIESSPARSARWPRSAGSRRRRSRRQHHGVDTVQGRSACHSATASAPAMRARGGRHRRRASRERDDADPHDCSASEPTG